MAPLSRSRIVLFLRVCAALLALTAVNHARLAAEGAGNVARHEVFVGLNAALGLLLVVRPRWALVPTVLLSLQQLSSHGSDLIHSIVTPSESFDWASVGVLLFFPALITLLVVERRTADTPAPPRAERTD